MWSVGCILGELIIGKPIFPGTSTLNQIERVLELTGKPSQEDIEAIASDHTTAILSSINITKKKSFHQFFPGANEHALDLLKKLLVFNPNHRLTAEQALKHKYVEQFASPEEEIICDHVITIPMDDNTKFSIKEYRDAIYADIIQKRRKKLQERYLEKLGVTADGSQQKQPSQTTQSSNNNTNNSNNRSVNSSMTTASSNHSTVQSNNVSSTSQSVVNHQRSYSGYSKVSSEKVDDKEKVLQEKKQNYVNTKPSSYYTSSTVQSTSYQKQQPVTKQNSIGGTSYTSSALNTSTTSYTSTSVNKGYTTNYGSYYYQSSQQPVTSNVQARPSSQGGYLGPHTKVATSGTGALMKKK